MSAVKESKGQQECSLIRLLKEKCCLKRPKDTMKQWQTKGPPNKRMPKVLILRKKPSLWRLPPKPSTALMQPFSSRPSVQTVWGNKHDTCHHQAAQTGSSWPPADPSLSLSTQVGVCAAARRANVVILQWSNLRVRARKAKSVSSVYFETKGWFLQRNPLNTKNNWRKSLLFFTLSQMILLDF